MNHSARTDVVDSGPLPSVRRPALRIGAFSMAFRARPLLLVIVAALVLALVFVVGLGLGAFRLSPAEVMEVLLGGGHPADRLAVLELRLPRAVAAVLVGAALGLSGAIIQTVARNPLASPDILGVTWGAGAAVTAAIVLGGTSGGILATTGLPGVALAGGLLAGLAVFGLTYRDGLDSLRLLLVGVGVMAIASSATVWLLSAGDVNDAGRALIWLTGSLNGRGWNDVVPLAITLAILVPPTLIGSRTLGALQFDDDTVHAIGVRVTPARGVLLLAAVIFAAVATAVAGPIQFVALCAPQIALRLARMPRPPLVLSMLLAAVLVLAADLISRAAFGTAELPVGIVTAVLGAPYLIYLITRRRRGDTV
ncbi:FecCD family ABC transporter permease [Nocardia alba]|uniref:Iron complex transport system permease protein n=1 Tax=Nocardia alba TaxID=225051 RepID=A0A4R1FRJ3_9NOCA|nr:iron chelate uptake ABC transporter family permease subunit [Nocardia alba]TCJ94948.1 iron complex transport system permease protein [Nocardia alba]